MSKGNHTGKGGFADHPENRNSGAWDPRKSLSYQYKRFMAMTVEELGWYALGDKSERTVAEDIAYCRIVAARKSLPDTKEITDRTEGKPSQAVELTGKDGGAIEQAMTFTYMPEPLPDEQFGLTSVIQDD